MPSPTTGSAARRSIDPIAAPALSNGMTTHVEAHPHPHHDQIAKRLKRAEGHLRSVVQMIDAGRDCLVIAQQLHAVEKAISEAKRALIKDHLDHCIEEVVGALPRDKRQPIDDFKAITRYL